MLLMWALYIQSVDLVLEPSNKYIRHGNDTGSSSGEMLYSGRSSTILTKHMYGKSVPWIRWDCLLHPPRRLWVIKDKTYHDPGVVLETEWLCEFGRDVDGNFEVR